MVAEKLEKRIAVLEDEVARLKARIDEKETWKKPWWEEIAGAFEGDPYYKEAMELGRKYRKAQRAKSTKNGKSKAKKS